MEFSRIVTPSNKPDDSVLLAAVAAGWRPLGPPDGRIWWMYRDNDMTLLEKACGIEEEVKIWWDGEQYSAVLEDEIFHVFGRGKGKTVLEALLDLAKNVDKTKEGTK